ncbi:hypothetical protein [Klebsiella pneumoniae]|uniref:hypothetical protein n=1 Tax=Klebsiella pneumoniae TaxID=573 RepID=UPI0022AC5C96|nr:hypothetical protein [Klebsiella pneumoniae]
MELFDLLTIKITLPAQAVPARKVGGNLVHKLLFRSTTVSAQVRNARFPGYFELVTGLKPPLDYIYLKDPNSRGKCSDGVASLKAKEGANKQVISSQADSLIKISRIWADFFPANTSNQPI